MKEEKKTIKRLTGVLVSNKVNNAYIVKVSRKFAHPKYKRFITVSKRYKISPVENLKLGSTVMIESCKPVSRDICFKFVKVLNK